MAFELDDITAHIVDAALKLHIRLGPGLFESVYTGLLAQALRRRGLYVESEKRIEVIIDGLHLNVVCESIFSLSRGSLLN